MTFVRVSLTVDQATTLLDAVDAAAAYMPDSQMASLEEAVWCLTLAIDAATRGADTVPRE